MVTVQWWLLGDTLNTHNRAHVWQFCMLLCCLLGAAGLCSPPVWPCQRPWSPCGLLPMTGLPVCLQIFMGYFSSPELAARAYDRKLIELHGPGGGISLPLHSRMLLACRAEPVLLSHERACPPLACCACSVLCNDLAHAMQALPALTFRRCFWKTPGTLGSQCV